ncbi:MAG: tyrosine-type recombinase/integrase [Cetobacterium sp.]|uniref:tyrosine-type recombinase/integrase n=1 Tax=Cetobacterium TaxID=180162 RepID=UPI001F059899|nr:MULTISPECIES: tyrosine-type recombinase/integrase [Cetobacterium]MCX3068294.1 tyrosine-type recombinase/integrase [Cetobacterium somerae]UPO97023.1 tyrosine-type recombinase/integrase [Cetobacterium somerae]
MKLLENFIKYKADSKSLKKETLDLYYGDIKDFESFVEKDFLNIKKEDILKYIEFLKNNYQPNSIIRKISTIKTFYKYLLEKRFINDNPSEGIVIEKAPEKELETLELWEINSILDACGKDYKGLRDKLLIKLLVETNLSINDVLKIKISDLELVSYKIIYNDEKGEKIRISDELSKELEDYIKDIRNYLSNGNSNLVFYSFSRQSFRARFISLGKKCGIEREITPNMLRNTLKTMVKCNDEINEEQFFLDLKDKYFKIGIGDD